MALEQYLMMHFLQYKLHIKLIKKEDFYQLFIKILHIFLKNVYMEIPEE
jgi:hypothetical protein